MRRKEKQIINRDEIDAIIHASQVCRLAMARGDQPYLVPLSFGYDGDALYLHTADRGKKIDFMEANPKVCFEFERAVNVISNPEAACKWSFSFECVIGEGTVSEVTDPHGKEAALTQIMAHYSDQQWEIDPKQVARTRVWRVDIQALNGKRSLK